VVVHVEDEVLSHHGKADQANIARSFRHYFLQDSLPLSLRVRAVVNSGAAGGASLFDCAVVQEISESPMAYPSSNSRKLPGQCAVAMASEKKEKKQPQILRLRCASLRMTILCASDEQKAE
jgi:hypothetical protein